MVTYLIKSTLCLTLFLAFYHLVLEREKMHRFNRYYLLSSVLISFLTPLYTIYIKAIKEPIAEFTQLSDNNIFTEEITLIEEPVNYWNYLIYFSIGVSTILLIRFIKNLYSIYRKVSVSEKFKYKSSTIILVADNILPHTFWNYIFINKQEYETQKIEQELFTHELTHVAQKHTFDVLLIELLKVVFWFNPIFYILKKSIQLNHEFLADTNVVSQHKNVSKYQHLLINTSAWSNEYALASNLHYLVTKKRILMMTKQTSKEVIRLKKLAVLSLIIGAIFLFAERVEAQEEKIEIAGDSQNAQNNKEAFTSKLPNGEAIEIWEDKVDVQELELLREFSFRNIITKISKDKNGDAYYRDYYSFSEEEKSKQIPGKLNSKQLKEFELFKKNKRENKLPKIKRLDIIESYKIFSKKIKKDRKFRYGDYISLSNIYKELSVRQRKLVESPKVVFGKMAPKKEYIDAPIKRKSSKQSVSTNTALEDIKQELKNVNALKLSIEKDTIKKPISVKLGNLSASKYEIKEYKSILAKGKKERFFKHKDILKMQYLYSTMSKEQKKTVENYASVIPPPPPPRMVKKGNVSNIPPPPPPTAPKVKKGEKSNTPPLPPPVKTKDSFTKNGIEKGWFHANNQTLYYVKKDKKTNYFNRWGNEVDKEGKLKTDDNVVYYLNGKRISKKEVDKLHLNEIKTINVKKENNDSDSIYIISKK